jgi:EAL domain-containing protein (putative c-di-GMP-specific phosphodiesterase class I)/GGDEF domain-containing protein
VFGVQEINVLFPDLPGHAGAQLMAPSFFDHRQAASAPSIGHESSAISSLPELLRHGGLTPVFQLIAHLPQADVLGFEALIRGPEGSALQWPQALFAQARALGLTHELERQCCRLAVAEFVRLGLPGRLFLNVSPSALLANAQPQDDLIDLVTDLGLAPQRIVIELTESVCPDSQLESLRQRTDLCRNRGMQVAIDDLGEGYSGLRRWLELRPGFVKLDRSLLRSLEHDPLRRQLIRSLQDAARISGAVLVAEGVENDFQLRFLLETGVECAQGFFLGRPEPTPEGELPGMLNEHLEGERKARQRASRDAWSGIAPASTTAAKLLRQGPVVTPETCNNDVCDVFTENPAVQSLPVVKDGIPVGMIMRSTLVDRFAKPYQRELYGRKACRVFMDDDPIIVDRATSLPELSHIVVRADAHQLISDFIITDKGQYAGIGTSLDLLRELTDLQISAARYANPLTQLPGNVLIDQQIDLLLHEGGSFSVCYVDLDNFKPFNDVFGYKKGDEVIQLTGRLLSGLADPSQDFVGHIGGDDFILLWRSVDWSLRCERILVSFQSAMLELGGAAGGFAAGYYAEDRRGKRQFYSYPSLSIGALTVEPGHFDSHHAIASAAADAKAQAKKTPGNSLFIERRRMNGGAV